LAKRPEIPSTSTGFNWGISKLILHHLCALAAINLPLLEQRWALWVAAGILVEINAFFIFLRRQQGWRDVWLVHAAFYMTWGILRCALYPLGLALVANDYLAYSSPRGGGGGAPPAEPIKVHRIRIAD